MTQITIIDARYVIPVIPENIFLEHHSVVIKEGKIIDLLPTDGVDKKYHGEVTRFRLADDHCLIPGLINGHCHAAMSLLRGLADDVQLMDWLMHYMWPAEGEFVSEDFVRVGSRITAAEMIKCGVTAVNDMYFYPSVTAKVISDAGMRGLIGAPMINFPSGYAKNIDEYYDKAVEVIEEYKNHPRVRAIFAPHAPYTVDDATFLRIKKKSQELDLRIHCHIHETKSEIENHINDSINHGLRPIERLEKLGLFDDRLIAAHMTHLSHKEVQLVAKNGVHVVSCPESNLKLGSGVAPVRELTSVGANVCLGTDGPASNDDLDMLGEMRTGAMIDKLKEEDVPLPAWRSLQMATLNGAKAIGIDAVVGSLEIGKEADVVAVKMCSMPIYNPINSIVYNGTNRVEYVWVQGKILLEKGVLKTIDESLLHKNSNEYRDKIISWDIKRKKADVALMRSLLDDLNRLTDNSQIDLAQLEKWRESITKINDSLFHWMFFATKGEARDGASVDELKNFSTAFKDKMVLISKHLDKK